MVALACSLAGREMLKMKMPTYMDAIGCFLGSVLGLWLYPHQSFFDRLVAFALSLAIMGVIRGWRDKI